MGAEEKPITEGTAILRGYIHNHTKRNVKNGEIIKKRSPAHKKDKLFY